MALRAPLWLQGPLNAIEGYRCDDAVLERIYLDDCIYGKRARHTLIACILFFFIGFEIIEYNLLSRRVSMR
jgi:hypothetical protein